VARQRFLVTLGEEGSASVVLSTRCSTASGAAQIREALATEKRLTVVAAAPARPGVQRPGAWWESADLLTLALFVLPACCHSAGTTILTDELSAGAAAKATSVCLGSAVSIKIVHCCFGGGRSALRALTPLQLRVAPAGFGVATTTMAALVAWVLAMETTLLTAVLCVVVFGWAITSACMVAPLLLASAEQRQARHYETLKQLRWTAAALAKVPLLRHRDLRELESSACAHTLGCCVLLELMCDTARVPVCVCTVSANLSIEEYAHGDVIIQEGAHELDAAMYLLESGEGGLCLHHPARPCALPALAQRPNFFYAWHACRHLSGRGRWRSREALFPGRFLWRARFRKLR
jgi:hypothetical protein